MTARPVWVTVEFPDAEAAAASRIMSIRVSAAQPPDGGEDEEVWRVGPGGSAQVWPPSTNDEDETL